MKTLIKEWSIALAFVMIFTFGAYGGYYFQTHVKTPEPVKVSTMQKVKNFVGLKDDRRPEVEAMTETNPYLQVEFDKPEPTFWNKTKTVTGTLWNKTKNTSEKAWNKTSEFAGNTWDKTTEATSSAYDKTSTATKNVWSNTKEFASTLYGKVKDLKSSK